MERIGKTRRQRLFNVCIGMLVIGLLAATPALAGAPAAPPATAPTGESPSDFIMWLKCGDLLAMTDADLDQWRARGVDGFTCNIQWLKGMGGTQDFTGDPAASLAGANFSLQRAIRDTNIVGRAANRGMKLYLGAYLSNYLNPRTPLREWFDDAGWNSVVLPKFRDLAGAAKLLGFAGITFDEEMYSQSGGGKATWKWSYPGNTRSEAEVRAMVRTRGQQLMSAIVQGYPNVTILDYAAMLPESWAERADTQTSSYASLVHLDFWDGMTSVESYREIDFLEAIFYKTPHMSGVSWDAALTFDLNRFYALLSRRLSHWDYASQHIGRIPFAWIDAGPRPYEAARPPAEVAKQLEAFRRWSSGSSLVNYMWGGTGNGFDYTPYVSAMRAAGTRGIVDDHAPDLTVSSSTSGQKLSGTATDDYAIKSVSWKNDITGASGAAAMTWTVLSGDGKRTPWTWRMDWTADVAGLVAGDNPITVTATDIHGLTSSATVHVGAVADPWRPGPLVPPTDWRPKPPYQGASAPDQGPQLTQTQPAPTTTVPQAPTTIPEVPTVPAPPIAAPPIPGLVTFLSDLNPSSASNGYGPYERNLSNGGPFAGDGAPIRLNGVTYPHGLGTHARAEIAYPLAQAYSSFVVDVGVDDECGAAGSVVFQVYVDGAKVAESGLLRGASATTTLTVPVTGASTLRLVVTNGGDGTACDHADWADARLLRICQLAFGSPALIDIGR